MEQTRQRILHWVRQFPLLVWLLGIGSFMNIGTLSLLWPMNAIYIHDDLGQPMTVAGMVLMANSGAGFLGNFLGGWLYDRVGPVRVLLIGLGLSAALAIVPVAFHSWWVYVGFMTLFGATCAMASPVMSSLVAHAWPEGGRRAFNFIYVANNLGVAVGTACGGVIAQFSFNWVFLSIVISYLLFLILVVALFRQRFNQAYHFGTERRNHKDGTTPNISVTWGPIITLLAGYVVSWAIYVQWQATVSVYMQSLHFSLSLYSVLWTLNGLLIFLGQPLLARVVRRFPSLTLHMLVGVCLIAMAFGLLLTTTKYSGFVMAMVIMTFGEMFVWPAVPAAVAEVSPPERLGTLQGLVGSSATLGRMIGPVLGGWLYDHTSVHFLMVTIITGTLVPIACFLSYRVLTVRSQRTALRETNITA